MRTDIQGLRALAVVLVLLHHLWPGQIRGGFVGVDVFFVISGFLITSHLLSRPPTKAGDLLDFWGRRIRRLLPAATLVIVTAVTVGYFILFVRDMLLLTRTAMYSSVYIVNWKIAAWKTDYFAQDEPDSPLLHFWSLAIEEQFYIVWPALIGLGLLVAKRRGVAAAMLLVFSTSLAYSVYLTDINPARAYFITTTRMWELALGGLAAALLTNLTIKDAIRAALAWLGLALIISAAVFFNAATAFPGWIALIPTLGTVAIIVAVADNVSASPNALWRIGLVQRIGDSSYAAYLWHWPLIVLTIAALDRPLRVGERLAILVTTLLISFATTQWIENPVRRSRRLNTSRLLTYTLGIALVASTITVAYALERKSRLDSVRLQTATLVVLERNARCAGAASLRDSACDVSMPLITSPEFAVKDFDVAFSTDCSTGSPFTDHKTCEFGETSNPSRRIALFGNSHAGHWGPVLEALAKQQGWQLTTYLTGRCWSISGIQQFDDPADTERCARTLQRSTDEIARGGFDLVIAANMTDREFLLDPEQFDSAVKGYDRSLRSWADRGIPVLVFRDTPHLPELAPECLARADEDPDACQSDQAEVLFEDPLAAAAQRNESGLVTLADFNHRICIESSCRSVVGGVIVMRDKDHLSRTFVHSLASDIAPHLTRVLENR